MFSLELIWVEAQCPPHPKFIVMAEEWIIEITDKFD